MCAQAWLIGGHITTPSPPKPQSLVFFPTFFPAIIFYQLSVNSCIPCQLIFSRLR